jgi:hypothetical protein
MKLRDEKGRFINLDQLRELWGLQPFATNLVESEMMTDEQVPVIEQSQGTPAKPVTSFFESGPKDTQGRKWDVVIIEAGKSLNGRIYTPTALRNAVTDGLFENLPCVCLPKLDENGAALLDHPESEHANLLVKNTVGKFVNARFDESRQAVLAEFHFIDDDMRKRNLEAFRADGKPLFGFSINGEGDGVATREGFKVELISKLNSTDGVTHPAAGGRFLRLVASVLKSGSSSREGGFMDPIKLLLAICRDVKPALLEGRDTDKLHENVGDAIELVKMLMALDMPEVQQHAEALGMVLDALNARAEAEKEEAPAEAQAEEAKETQEAADLEGKVNALSAELDRIRKAEEARAVDAAISEAGLKGEIAETVRELAAVKGLKEAIKRGKKLAEQAGWDTPKLTSTSVGTEPTDRFVKALEGGMRGRDCGGVPRFISFKEAVGHFTGMQRPSSRMIAAVITRSIAKAFRSMHPSHEEYAELSTLQESGRQSLIESLRGKYKMSLQESISTATFDDAFADTLRRILVADYDLPDLNDWRQVMSEIRPVEDFRATHFIQKGQYPQVATVSEGDPFQPFVTPTDRDISVTVQKYGNTEDHTWEAMLADDIRALVDIPQRMNRAMLQTRRKRFWLDLIINNALIDDGIALFDAAHSNDGSDAFGLTTLSAQRAAMRKQTAYNGTFHELGTSQRFVFGPPELEEAFARVFRSPNRSEANDPSGVFALHSGITPIILDFETDDDQWGGIGDPSRIPTAAFAHIRGFDQPELTVNDNPTVGPLFDEDKFTIKIKDAFEFVILDFRAFNRQTP